jgi:ATP:corrinoid adenosyltransferase
MESRVIVDLTTRRALLVTTSKEGKKLVTSFYGVILHADGTGYSCILGAEYRAELSHGEKRATAKTIKECHDHAMECKQYFIDKAKAFYNLV